MIDYAVFFTEKELNVMQKFRGIYYYDENNIDRYMMYQKKLSTTILS